MESVNQATRVSCIFYSSVPAARAGHRRRPCSAGSSTWTAPTHPRPRTPAPCKPDLMVLLMTWKLHCLPNNLLNNVLIYDIEIALCTKLPVKNNVLTYGVEITLCTKLPVKNNVLFYSMEITLCTKLPVKNNNILYLLLFVVVLIYLFSYFCKKNKNISEAVKMRGRKLQGSVHV